MALRLATGASWPSAESTGSTPIFRRSAAFFLRRTFRGDPLYAAVFTAYVRRLLREGFNIEFFVERLLRGGGASGREHAAA